MSAPNLSSGDISALIDHLLKSKDPATVGLRKILKTKQSAGHAYPLHSLEYEEFYVEGKTKESLNHDERIVVALEKRVNDLRVQVETLEKECTRREQSALEKGKDEGFKKGHAAALEKTRGEYAVKINELQQRFNAFCDAVESSKHSMYVNAHTVLLELCFEIARKIIHTEVICNPDVVISVIKKALTYIADKDRLVIRVAKDDLETVSGRKDFWAPVGERLESVIIEPDERLERGGCIIESNSGAADARLGVQLSELRELVEKTWKSICASAPKPGDVATDNGA
jgi:flagellar assembly protein FliH